MILDAMIAWFLSLDMNWVCLDIVLINGLSLMREQDGHLDYIYNMDLALLWVFCLFCFLGL